MNNPGFEETKNRSLRLPDRLWHLLKKAAEEEGVSVNNLFWRMAEDFLVRRGSLDKKARKRLPLK